MDRGTFADCNQPRDAYRKFPFVVIERPDRQTVRGDSDSCRAGVCLGVSNICLVERLPRSELRLQ